MNMMCEDIDFNPEWLRMIVLTRDQSVILNMDDTGKDHQK
jgi:hypothetical protein